MITQTTLPLTSSYVVWCYVPSEDGEGWNAPYVCQDEIGCAADAYDYARRLRCIYHGHLFAALPVGRTPLPTR